MHHYHYGEQKPAKQFKVINKDSTESCVLNIVCSQFLDAQVLPLVFAFFAPKFRNSRVNEWNGEELCTKYEDTFRRRLLTENYFLWSRQTMFSKHAQCSAFPPQSSMFFLLFFLHQTVNLYSMIRFHLNSKFRIV